MLRGLAGAKPKNPPSEYSKKTPGTISTQFWLQVGIEPKSRRWQVTAYPSVTFRVLHSLFLTDTIRNFATTPFVLKIDGHVF